MSPLQAVRDTARTHAPDLYLAALLAPRARREDLIILAAYAGDIARIPLTVSEPMLGQIRLQWWRDAFEKVEPGSVTGNPVADAVIELMHRRGLPRETLLAPLDAYDHLLARGALSEPDEFTAYLDATSGAAFRMAAHVLDCPAAQEADKLLSAAGRAYGRARVAIDLPYHLARGRVPVPLAYFGGRDPRGLAESDAAGAAQEATATLAREARSDLARLKPLFSRGPVSARAAVLPAALIEPYFKALQRESRDSLCNPADISPLTRASRLWLARWRGKV